MKWTEELPTEEGYYFCVVQHFAGNENLSRLNPPCMHVVHAFNRYMGKGLNAVLENGRTYDFTDPRYLRWSERIEEPGDKNAAA